VVICLNQSANNLHIVQLMPFFVSLKSRIVYSVLRFSFIVTYMYWPRYRLEEPLQDDVLCVEWDIKP